MKKTIRSLGLAIPLALASTYTLGNNSSHEVSAFTQSEGSTGINYISPSFSSGYGETYLGASISSNNGDVSSQNFQGLVSHTFSCDNHCFQASFSAGKTQSDEFNPTHFGIGGGYSFDFDKFYFFSGINFTPDYQNDSTSYGDEILKNMVRNSDGTCTYDFSRDEERKSYSLGGLSFSLGLGKVVSNRVIANLQAGIKSGSSYVGASVGYLFNLTSKVPKQIIENPIISFDKLPGTQNYSQNVEAGGSLGGVDCPDTRG